MSPYLPNGLKGFNFVLIFFSKTSLSPTTTSSQMAQEWCVSYGVLSMERAEELWNLICRRKKGKGAPVPSPVKAKQDSKTHVTKKRKVIEDDAVADTGGFS